MKLTILSVNVQAALENAFEFHTFENETELKYVSGICGKP